MKIIIPMLPDKALSPNARVHWSVKHRATQSFRNAAFVCALEGSRFAHPGYDKAEVSMTLVIPSRRYIKDPDNMLASLKSAIDGCVDAGIIKDDSDEHLRYKLPIMYEIDKTKTSGIILEFRAGK